MLKYKINKNKLEILKNLREAKIRFFHKNVILYVFGVWNKISVIHLHSGLIHIMLISARHCAYIKMDTNDRYRIAVYTNRVQCVDRLYYTFLFSTKINKVTCSLECFYDDWQLMYILSAVVFFAHYNHYIINEDEWFTRIGFAVR